APAARRRNSADLKPASTPSTWCAISRRGCFFCRVPDGPLSYRSRYYAPRRGPALAISLEARAGTASGRHQHLPREFPDLFPDRDIAAHQRHPQPRAVVAQSLNGERRADDLLDPLRVFLIERAELG